MAVPRHPANENAETNRIKREERRAAVAALYRAGITHYREIQERLGIKSLRTIHEDLKVIFSRLQDEQMRDMKRYVAIELERLEGEYRAIYPEIEAGNFRAIEVAQKIHDRKAKLLGLDAPTRTETTGKDGGPIQTESSTSVNLQKLSVDELEALSALLDQATNER